jgi:hypothetical protein
MHATEPEAKHGDQKKRVGSTRVADPATILPEGVIGKTKARQMEEASPSLIPSHMSQMRG